MDADDGLGPTSEQPGGPERRRVESFGQLADGLTHAGDWYLWGPYLSERQWGTVREDYSPDGEAWSSFPHDQARSRAYRWGEDGMAGFCDVEQRLCVALALWNGRDPILKERMFGLTGPEGNHGEDVKEYWWFLDAVPSHAWNRWRYHYPRRAFPYDDLIAENARRGKLDPEYELLDTGAFDDGTWIVEVDWAKADATDLLMTIRVTNDSDETDELHVLPTAWFRNTWDWDYDVQRPMMQTFGPRTIAVEHPTMGPLEFWAGDGPDGVTPTQLFCDNETNAVLLYGADEGPPFAKDGINDHVVNGSATVNPAQSGTKAAFWYRASVSPGETVEFRLRLRPATGNQDGDEAEALLGPSHERIAVARLAEADEFYRALNAPDATEDEARVMRQAFAGMLWSKQLYYYEVERWLAGDPTQPAPPPGRGEIRNGRWGNFEAFDIMSMPDPWEYPWFAAWDLAFHTVTLAHIDPAFAKYQLLLVCREWFQNPSGALPAYEWDFGDVNPPVQAWAALLVYAIDGARDHDFLSRVFDKLLVNFTWWVNREDADGSNLFEGGFLGLDNIGPLDRSHLPPGTRLEQSDATGWMAFYALNMMAIASVLTYEGIRPAADLMLKFMEHFSSIRLALEGMSWDPDAGLFEDQLVTADGQSVPMAVRSMVGIVPLLAGVGVGETFLQIAERLDKGFAQLMERMGGQKGLTERGVLTGVEGARHLLLTVVDPDRLRDLFRRLFDEDEFLSPYGLRALSAVYRDQPYRIDVGEIHASIDYEPAESTSAMFGGNSNWRGPIWMPLNYLTIGALVRYHSFFGDSFTVEYPTGSGHQHTLLEIAEDLRHRLISLFTVGPDGRRPIYGGVTRLQTDPAWKDNVQFNEYFHGDNGAGLGASHQTGWTGLVADLLRGPSGSAIYFSTHLQQLLAHPETT